MPPQLLAVKPQWYVELRWQVFLREQQCAHVDSGQGMEQSENIQEPQDHGDDDYAVQDGLD